MSFTLPPVDPELIKKLQAGRPYTHGQVKFLVIKLPDDKTAFAKLVYDYDTDMWTTAISSDAVEDLDYFYGAIREERP